MTETHRRTGSETKAEAQRIALSLFISKGYDATSLREIAEELGISKASLYYHFASKEEIVLSGLSDRGKEAAQLLAWVQEQPPGPELLEKAVLRWVDSMSIDKLRGIRFVNANPAVMRKIASEAGRARTTAKAGGADRADRMGGASKNIRDGLEGVIALVAGPEPDPTRLLLIRMAFLSINSAVSASQGTAITDAEIITAARELALSILRRL